MKATTGQASGYKRERFVNSQLGLVVAQVRFPPLSRFDDSDARKRFQDALRRDYPLFARQRRVDIRLRAGDEPRAEPGDEVLRYSSIDYDWSLILGNDLVALECRSFTMMEDFLEHLRDIWKALVAHFDPRYQLRSSLRFVNELRNSNWSTYSQWRAVLNKRLIGFDPGEQFGGVVSHTIGEFALMRENDERVMMRRGFLRGTTIVPIDGDAKNPSEGPFYLIDNEYLSSSRGDFELDPSERFMRYNNFLHNMFRWAIERDDNEDLLKFLRSQK